MSFTKICGWCFFSRGAESVEFVLKPCFASGAIGTDLRYGGGSYKDFTEPVKPYYKGTLGISEFPKSRNIDFVGLKFPLYNCGMCVGYDSDGNKHFLSNVYSTKCVITNQTKTTLEFTTDAVQYELEEEE